MPNSSRASLPGGGDVNPLKSGEMQNTQLLLNKLDGIKKYNYFQC